MKKTINPHDSEDLSHERFESNDMMTVISKSSSEEKDSKSNYSYFFSEMYFILDLALKHQLKRNNLTFGVNLSTRKNSYTIKTYHKLKSN